MKNHVIYETNADYDATYSVLLKNRNVWAAETKTGKLQFRIKGYDVDFFLSPYGKLEAFWNSLSEKKSLLQNVKALLVPKEPPLQVKPVSQQIFRTIYYGEKPDLQIYWCEKPHGYSKPNFSRLGKKDKELLLLDTEFLKFIFELEYGKDVLEKCELFGNPILVFSKK